MSTKVKPVLKEIIEEWKKLGVVNGQMEFSCGGDSMNDYTFNFYDDKGKVINDKNNVLTDYFENEVFNRVQFYEASDGHYQGEAGVVEITLDDEDEDEDNHDFSFSKSAQAEFNETLTGKLEILLTKDEYDFLKEYVSNINGGDGGEVSFNYSKDFIMTDKLTETFDTLSKKIDDEVTSYEVPDAVGEYNEWYSFTSDVDGEEQLVLNETKGRHTLTLEVSQTYIQYQDSLD